MKVGRATGLSAQSPAAPAALRHASTHGRQSKAKAAGVGPQPNCLRRPAGAPMLLRCAQDGTPRMHSSAALLKHAGFLIQQNQLGSPHICCTSRTSAAAGAAQPAHLASHCPMRMHQLDKTTHLAHLLLPVQHSQQRGPLCSLCCRARRLFPVRQRAAWGREMGGGVQD